MAKMRDVDAAAIKVAIRVVTAFRCLHFASAHENHIGGEQQIAFTLNQFWRRAFELLQFVHTLVNRGDLVHLSGERCRGHRIKKPLNGGVELAFKRAFQCILHDEATLLIIYGIALMSGGHCGLQDCNVGMIGKRFQFIRRCRNLVGNERALDKEDAMSLRQA